MRSLILRFFGIELGLLEISKLLLRSGTYGTMRHRCLKPRWKKANREDVVYIIASDKRGFSCVGKLRVSIMGPRKQSGQAQLQAS